MFVKIFIILGFAGGIVAFFMAFIISVEEYQHHFKGNKIYKESLPIAIVAFVSMFTLMIISGIILSIVLSEN